MKIKPKLVYVEWIDSHTGNVGWRDVGFIVEAVGPLYCRTVGWLIAEAKGYKTIVAHLTGEDEWNTLVQGSGEISIPNSCIKQLKYLKVKGVMGAV